jgi:uncharacterized protein YjbJ (UPF0337 family)
MADDLRKDSLSNRVKGSAKELGGKMQHAAGDLTGDREQQIRGKARELEGKAQRRVGQAQDSVADARRSIDRSSDDLDPDT